MKIKMLNDIETVELNHSKYSNKYSKLGEIKNEIFVDYVMNDIKCGRK